MGQGKAVEVTYSSIVKVTYGIKGKTRDVTAKGGSVRVGNYNGHFGDPVSGTVKELVVTVMVGGRQKTVKIGENTDVTLTKVSK